MSEEAAGKRVSWVELYFDLIFVFAVGQMTHIMVAGPHWGGLEVGFLLLRNDERPRERSGRHPPARRSRAESVRAMFRPPADPARRSGKQPVPGSPAP
jgi:low temperature requirement A protein (LtrA)